MRTTLDIDEDVLKAAKEIARREQVSAGQVVTRLLRQAMSGEATEEAPGNCESTVRGFRPFAAGGRVVTNETIDKLRDQESV